MSAIASHQSLVFPFAYPLDEFYALARRALPPLDPVKSDRMPEPYRGLLVHERDMTTTLEEFHGAKIHLNLLSRQERGDFYFREVVLALEGSEQPVEFGAIKINLSCFPPPARLLILEARMPLGSIIHQFRIEHRSRPKGFFRLQSDGFINDALKISDSQWLYGRRNTLFDHGRRPLAEIVEILPPVRANGNLNSHANPHA